MSNFLSPFFRATDASGNAISGAVLHFYDTTTVNNRSTYPTYALAAAGGAGANANPVVADANGWFGRIYLQPDYLYTVVLKTAVGGTTIWTADGVDSSFLNDSSLATRIGQIASNPMDHGATGDGIANDATAIQAAIDASTGVVDLLGKTYKCNSILTLKSGLTLRNGTIDFSSNGYNYYMSAIGTIAATKALTGNVSAGATTIPLQNVTGLSAGDLIFISSSGAYGGASGKGGELCRVASISVLNVLVDAPLHGSYTTANSAYVREITPLSDVVLDDVSFVASNATAITGPILLAQYCDRFTVRNCRFSGIKIAGISISKSSSVVVENSKFESGAAGSIGLNFLDLCQGIRISKTQFSGVAKGVALGLDDAGYTGVTRDVTIDNCTLEGCSTSGVNVGILTQHLSVSGCVFRSVNPADGINIVSADDVRIYGCTFVGGDYGIDDTTVTNLVAIANYYTGQTTGQIRGSAAAVLTLAATAGNQSGLVATASGTGTGVGGTSVDGHGVVAQSDTTSPAKSALRIVPQDTAPATSPESGDVFVDSVAKGVLLHTGNEWAKIPMARYIAAALGTPYANTTSDLELQSYSIPANVLRVGSRIKIRGVVFCTGGGAWTLTYGIGLVSGGAWTIWIPGTKVTPVTLDCYVVEYDLVMTAVGAGGAFIGHGMTFSPGDAFTTVATLSASLDTTAAHTIALHGKMGTANPAFGIRGHHFSVEIYP